MEEIGKVCGAQELLFWVNFYQFRIPVYINERKITQEEFELEIVVK
jgi:hypothetical protein